MSFENESGVARQVADLNRYGQALNRCESVDEVVSLTLEATMLLFESPFGTVAEVRDGELEVAHSTNPNIEAGDAPSEIAERAYDSGEAVVVTGDAARVDPDSDATAAVAVPAAVVDDVVAVIVMRTTREEEEFDEATVGPLEILAAHAATAVSNIRSRERLQRARRELEIRKETIKLYDRLLRHDLGNDLQVIAGLSEVLVDEAEGETVDIAERIERAARSSTDLVERVGDLVSTLEAQREPEPRDLRAVVAETVGDADAAYDDLTVEFDPEEFDYRVYAGDLLDSVFSNVLTNAAVHNEGPVTVAVRAEADRDEVVVRVADDGSGVPPEVRGDIFEMGVKGSDSDGTGFGLGFVRSLAESYGGTVTVRESDAGGAEFRVRLERV